MNTPLGPSRRLCTKSGLINTTSSNQSLLSTNSEIQIVPKKVTIRSYAEVQQLMDAAVAEDVRNISNATNRVETS